MCRYISEIVKRNSNLRNYYYYYYYYKTLTFPFQGAAVGNNFRPSTTLAKEEHFYKYFLATHSLLQVYNQFF